jgi:4-amino-4-deoxy-L-arabinose transferase-like glycosyltransferase
MDRIFRGPGLWLGAILCLALVCRLVDLDWDGGHAFHPDERALATAVERLSFQPLQLNPEFFAYGSLPIYAVKLAATAIGGIIQRPLGYAELLLLGRLLSALAGTLTVLVLYGLARRVYDRETGLLAAALLATCVLHLQHSRFMTTDVWLTPRRNPLRPRSRHQDQRAASHATPRGSSSSVVRRSTVAPNGRELRCSGGSSPCGLFLR